MEFNFRNPYWNNLDKLNYYERRILVACIAYYIENDNLITDDEYTGLCQSYLKLKKECSKQDIKHTELAYVFNRFEISTGMNLYHRLRKEHKHKFGLICENVMKGGRGWKK